METRPGRTWWLSFCDARKPQGAQFVGVVIVRADSFSMAVFEAHRLKCNPPGAEVQGTEWAPVKFVDPTKLGVLLTRDEAEALEAETAAKARAAGAYVAAVN